MKRISLLTFLAITIHLGLHAQTMHGRVIDDSTGTGLEQASVTISGTTRGTTSGVSDWSFIGTDIGLRFKTVRGRGVIVEKIYVKNISMRNIAHQAIFLDMYYFAKPPSISDVYAGAKKVDVPAVTDGTPQFRDIHISNIVCDGAEEGIFVRGLP